MLKPCLYKRAKHIYEMLFAVPIELIHAIKRSDVLPFKCFVVVSLGVRVLFVWVWYYLGFLGWVGVA